LILKHFKVHVRGYKEEGTTTTPFDMTVLNDLDRYQFAGDAVDRVKRLGNLAAYFKTVVAGQTDRASAIHYSSRRGPAGDSQLEVEQVA
jgi:phosphoketolase